MEVASDEAVVVVADAPRALAAAAVDGLISSMLSVAGVTGATADQVMTAPAPMMCSSVGAAM